MDEILNRIIATLEERHITKSKFLKDLGFNKSAMAAWVKGDYASYKSKLPEIAAYLEVSLEWLVGAKQKNKPAAESDELTENERDFIRKFRQLNALGKKLADSNLDALLNLQDKQAL